jgi:hypothetical protein
MGSWDSFFGRRRVDFIGSCKCIGIFSFYGFHKAFCFEPGPEVANPYPVIRLFERKISPGIRELAAEPVQHLGCLSFRIGPGVEENLYPPAIEGTLMTIQVNMLFNQLINRRICQNFYTTALSGTLSANNMSNRLITEIFIED